MKKATEGLLNALIVMTVFILIGSNLPKLVTQFIPTSYYYSITKPAITDNSSYSPGDYIRVIISRRSRIDHTGSQTMELSLVNINEVDVIKTERETINIESGVETLRFVFSIPDDSPPGDYIIHGTIEFATEGKERAVSFSTNTFTIE